MQLHFLQQLLMPHITIAIRSQIRSHVTITIASRSHVKNRNLRCGLSQGLEPNSGLAIKLQLADRIRGGCWWKVIGLSDQGPQEFDNLSLFATNENAAGKCPVTAAGKCPVTALQSICLLQESKNSAAMCRPHVTANENTRKRHKQMKNSWLTKICAKNGRLTIGARPF